MTRVLWLLCLHNLFQSNPAEPGVGDGWRRMASHSATHSPGKYITSLSHTILTHIHSVLIREIQLKHSVLTQWPGQCQCDQCTATSDVLFWVHCSLPHFGGALFNISWGSGYFHSFSFLEFILEGEFLVRSFQLFNVVFQIFLEMQKYSFIFTG